MFEFEDTSVDFNDAVLEPVLSSAAVMNATLISCASLLMNTYVFWIAGLYVILNALFK